MPLSMRLVSICSSRRGSAKTVTSSPTLFSSTTSRISALLESDVITSLTICCNDISSLLTSILPASMALNSRISSINPCMRVALRRMMARNRWLSASETSAPSRVSIKARMAVSGVRNSCETFERNSCRTCSSRSSLVTSKKTPMAPCTASPSFARSGITRRSKILRSGP